MYLFFFFTFYFAFWVFPSREYTWRHFSLRGLFARKYLNKETLVINMQKIIRGLLHTKIKFCEISFTSTQHLKKIKSWGGGLPNKKVLLQFTSIIHVYLPLCICLSLLIMIRGEKGWGEFIVPSSFAHASMKYLLHNFISYCAAY